MRIRILAAALALVAMVGVAFAASPATAGSGSSVAVCEDATFSSLAALTTSGTARWATPTTRAEKETVKYSGGTEIQKTPGKPTAGTINVYFHIVQASDGTGAVERGRPSTQQIAVLNMTFSGFYGGDDTGFRFRLVATDTTVNDAWFEGDDPESGSIERELAMKTALKRGGATDLNIYSTSGAGYLGFAYYPSITRSNRYEVLDGVLIHYGSLPGGFITIYNLGYTATHEVGHYLGLAHYVRAGLQGARRLRRRHARDGGSDYRLSGRKGHVPAGCGPRSGRELHGLLVRPLLHGVHAGPDGADAEAVRPLALEAGLGTAVRARRSPALHRPTDAAPTGSATVSTLKRTFRTSLSATTYVLLSSRCVPRLAASAWEPASSKSSAEITSQRMKPRAMSVWIVAAASRAVCPSRSVQARVSLSPTVKNAISPSASFNLRTTSSSAEGPSRNSAASSSGRSASSASSLQSIPCGPFSTARSGFVVSGSSSGGSSPGQSASVLPASRCSRSPTSVSSSVRLRGVARLRLLRDALVPTLDVIAIRDEQLELERLEVVGGRRVGREAVEHREDRVDLAQVAEERRARARNVDDADRRRRHLPSRHERGEPREAVVGDRRHPDVRLFGHGRVRGDLRACAGERVEQRRLAAVR